MANEIQYAYWRTDKPAEPGFSHELISNFTNRKEIDTLNMWPKDEDGNVIKTLTQGLQSLEKRLPNHPWLGTKVKKESGITYEWMTVQEVLKKAKSFGAGLMAKDLIPEVEGEGKMWRMLGI